MNKYYFTFGQDHTHSVNGYTYDKDVVCVIKAVDAETARDIMRDHFGLKWSFSYYLEPDMNYYPRGLKELN